MQPNGVPAPQIPPVSIQLNANQAAVVAALERLVSAVEVEVRQMDALWGQKEDAARLVEVTKAIVTQRDAYMQKCRRIVIAPTMPVIPGMG